jgi:hypothetical protein
MIFYDILIVTDDIMREFFMALGMEYDRFVDARIDSDSAF